MGYSLTHHAEKMGTRLSAVLMGILLLLSWGCETVQEPVAESVAAEPESKYDLEIITYRSGIEEQLRQAYAQYANGNLDETENLALELLESEPNCVDAKWLLFSVYHDQGKLGDMIRVITPLAIRRARESEIAARVLEEGSRGYVLCERNPAERRKDIAEQLNGDSQEKGIDVDTVKIDYNAGDGISVGDEYVIYQEGSQIIHPITEQVLHVEPVIVAKIVITKVFDTYSVGKVTQRRDGATIQCGMKLYPATDVSVPEAAPTQVEPQANTPSPQQSSQGGAESMTTETETRSTSQNSSTGSGHDTHKGTNDTPNAVLY